MADAYCDLAMKKSARFFAIALAALTTLALGRQVKPVSHYAFHYVNGTTQESLQQNWNGSISWNGHAANELWVQKDKAVYLITDKAVLDAMEKASRPLRQSAVNEKPGTDAWRTARDKERHEVYKKTDKIVEDAMSKGLGKKVATGP